MKRLKDTQIKYKLKINVIQKHIKDKDVYSNIPYRICCIIDKTHSSCSTCFDYNKKGKKELIKFIEKECYL